jgi:hypothetical protein
LRQLQEEIEEEREKKILPSQRSLIPAPPARFQIRYCKAGIHALNCETVLELTSSASRFNRDWRRVLTILSHCYLFNGAGKVVENTGPRILAVEKEEITGGVCVATTWQRME